MISKSVRRLIENLQAARAGILKVIVFLVLSYFGFFLIESNDLISAKLGSFTGSHTLGVLIILVLALLIVGAAQVIWTGVKKSLSKRENRN